MIKVGIQDYLPKTQLGPVSTTTNFNNVQQNQPSQVSCSFTSCGWPIFCLTRFKCSQQFSPPQILLCLINNLNSSDTADFHEPTHAHTDTYTHTNMQTVQILQLAVPQKLSFVACHQTRFFSTCLTNFNSLYCFIIIP